MPPKTRITKTEILTAAVNIVRDKGIDALNARILASRLKVSTQPIFSQYESMDSLKEDVISYAKRMYQWFIKQSTNNNACFDCVAFCMSYIQFAKKEKELFKLLFLSGLMSLDALYACEEEKLWIWAHGIAALIATSQYEIEDEKIFRCLSEIYIGLKNEDISKL